MKTLNLEFMSEAQFRKAIREAYEEGHWLYSHGSMTGCPHYEVREPMTSGQVATKIIKQFKEQGTVPTMPDQMVAVFE